MVVGVCRLSLFFPEGHSLKSKRQGLRRVVDRVRAKFNVAVAEVGQQESWQRARIGLAVVSNEGAHVRSMLQTITGFVEQIHAGPILGRELELLSYGEGEAFGDGPFCGSDPCDGGDGWPCESFGADDDGEDEPPAGGAA